MKKIHDLIDSYFIPIWLSVGVWLTVTLVNALLGDGTEYYKLITGFVNGGMICFWIFVLIIFIKNKTHRKIEGDISK